MTNEIFPTVSTLPALELHFAAGSANGVWCRSTNAHTRKKLHARLMRDVRNKAPVVDACVSMPITDGRFAQPVLRDFRRPGANGVEVFTRPHLPGGRP